MTETDCVRQLSRKQVPGLVTTTGATGRTPVNITTNMLFTHEYEEKLHVGGKRGGSKQATEDCPTTFVQVSVSI